MKPCSPWPIASTRFISRCTNGRRLCGWPAEIFRDLTCTRLGLGMVYTDGFNRNMVRSAATWSYHQTAGLSCANVQFASICCMILNASQQFHLGIVSRVEMPPDGALRIKLQMPGSSVPSATTVPERITGAGLKELLGRTGCCHDMGVSIVMGFTPIDGWFISWNVPLKRMMTPIYGNPHMQCGKPN